MEYPTPSEGISWNLAVNWIGWSPRYVHQRAGPRRLPSHQGHLRMSRHCPIDPVAVRSSASMKSGWPHAVVQRGEAATGRKHAVSVEAADSLVCSGQNQDQHDLHGL